MPPEIDTLIAASDLQGREKPGGKLLGEMLAEELERHSRCDRLPQQDRIGVLLCGDFFARNELDRRGGTGDVRTVFRAFANRFRWVVGVAGNHDHFGASPREFASFCREEGVHFLDGTYIDIDSIRIAGMSGIVGNPRRPFRRSTGSFIRTYKELLQYQPDIVLLHQGPRLPGDTDSVTMVPLEAVGEPVPALYCFGHKHRKEPLWQSELGSQYLNVDGRVVVLRHQRKQ